MTLTLVANSGEVAHRLTETEVIAYVLLDLAVIVAAARLFGWSRACRPICASSHSRT
jgi:hypothetical protein